MKFLKALLGLEDGAKSTSDSQAKSQSKKSGQSKASEAEQIRELDSLSSLAILEYKERGDFSRPLVLREAAEKLDQTTVNKLSEEQLLELAGYARSAEVRELLVGRFSKSTADELSAHLKNAPDRSRGLIAEVLASKLDSLADVQTLADTFKGRDKQTYRALKERAEAIKAGAAAEESLRTETASLFKDVKSLSERAVDSEYRARLAYLRTRVDEVDEKLSVQQRADLASQLDAADALVAQADEQARLAKESDERLANIDGERDLLIAAVNSEAGRLINLVRNEQVDELNESQERLRELEADWKSSNRDKKAPKAQQTAFAEALTRSRKLQERVAQHGDLASQFAVVTSASESSPASDADTDDAATVDAKAKETQTAAISTLTDSLSLINAESLQRYPELGVMLDWLEDNAKEHQALAKARRETERRVSELCRKGFSAARGGRVNQAFGIRRSIDELVEKHQQQDPTHTLAAPVRDKLQDLDDEISKLEDWQDYVVTPKKEALISDMQALVSAEIPVEERHNRIKGLQRQWRELRQRPGEASDQLWERFKSAADEAYAPCKEHFGELDKERDENLHRRYQLIETLKTYSERYDWSSAVWKDVEATVRKAKDEFHNIKPIAREARKEVEERFNETLAPVKAKLNEAYEQAKSGKTRLLEQARKLAEQKDLEIAIDQAKNLQTKWKEAGRTWVKADRELWTEFKSNIDGVFSRLTEKRDAEDQEKTAELEKAEAIKTELKAIESLDGDELLQKRAQKEELLEQLGEVGEMPYRKDKSMRRSIEDLASTIDRKIEKALANKSSADWKALLDLKKQLAVGEVDAEAAAEKAASLGALPDGLKSKAHKTLLAEKTTVDEDALRKLCIQAEVLLDQPSPVDDQALRTEYQMTLLQKGLGRQMSSAKELEKLVVEWLGVQAQDQNTFALLHDRFAKTALASL